ncbi:DNA polymerase III subunit gamma/tau [Geothrix sp. 21YS21S-2]|uniref:DNA polymerase III subunit gamma/tau n=1 Tax=Geothrix sp. 21YS21S-2 TaxID=3068893 RepID=UPI0027B89EE4|nr:DNA polymerase III subunit gamma/tau [Geothrix sp. 21YS21S-2]
MITLALKYRPRILSDLVGQEASVRALANALKKAKASGGAIHHQAFLFAGVRGTGKTSTARILARALNCMEGPTAEPCGVCDSCRASEQPDQNMDIVEIDAASRSSVEDARALREQVQTRPAFCRYRVYIIDEVHMMSRSAFDALLKILEEPPSHAVFVLATTELQDVPDTIKSRVQIFPFRLIPVAMVEARLRWVCEQEGVTWEEGSLRLLAEAGQGSMRDALTTLDRVISAGEGHVGEAMVREQLGIVPAVRVQAMLEALLAADSGAVLDNCRALTELGTDWISFWRELMMAFRDRMESDVRQGAGPQDLLRWARMLQLLLSRERDLRDTSLPDVVVELALLTAAQLPHLAPLDAMVKGQPAPAARPGGTRPLPVTGTAMAAAPMAPPPPVRPAPGSAQPSVLAPAARPTPPVPPSPAPGTRPAMTAAPTSGQVEAPSAAPSPSAAPAPVKDPGNLEQLRKGVGEALRQAPGGLPRTLGSLPHMATALTFQDGVLQWLFPPNVRNTAQDLERELSNPHLLEALRQVLPGLARTAITYETENRERPEDVLRADPSFQRLLADTSGEIVEVRREE